MIDGLTRKYLGCSQAQSSPGSWEMNFPYWHAGAPNIHNFLSGPNNLWWFFVSFVWSACVIEDCNAVIGVSREIIRCRAVTCLLLPVWAPWSRRRRVGRRAWPATSSCTRASSAIELPYNERDSAWYSRRRRRRQGAFNRPLQRSSCAVARIRWCKNSDEKWCGGAN